MYLYKIDYPIYEKKGNPDICDKVDGPWSIMLSEKGQAEKDSKQKLHERRESIIRIKKTEGQTRSEEGSHVNYMTK